MHGKLTHHVGQTETAKMFIIIDRMDLVCSTLPLVLLLIPGEQGVMGGVGLLDAG